jgi:hypothetical protein
VLRIHRRVAHPLGVRFGGFQSGRTFLIDRVRFIELLERIASGGDVSSELESSTTMIAFKWPFMTHGAGKAAKEP